MPKNVADSGEVKVRINTTVKGEPAKWLKAWKKRGIVTSYTDAVVQALRAFHREITENELKSVRLQNLKDIENFSSAVALVLRF